MTLGFRRIESVFAAGIASLALALPATAGAASSKYPPEEAARGFNGGLAGWSGSASFAGSCAAPLLCPSATNSFQPSGGADGGGHIRSAYRGVAGVTAVGGTTTAVFASPRFTYRGADGAQPREVALTLDRRANVDELLAVEGNTAAYSVRLVDLDAGGESIPAIEPRTLAGASSWRNVAVTIDPGDLVRGHDYRLLISSAYTTGTGVVVGGNADYDNVVLEATRGAGKGKAGGSDAAADAGSERLADLVRAAAPGTAVLAGRGADTRLMVRVKCPRKVGRACRIATQGLLRKRKPATARRTVKVRKGKARLVALKVKPGARRQLAKRKRLLVRHEVRAGKATAVVYKTRRLIRR